MLILLPPSETKAHGDDGAPLDFDSLSFASLNPIRRSIAELLIALSSGDNRARALKTLGISSKLEHELDANRELLSSPTMPAIELYTGVLYDALNASTLSPRARSRLAVGSALFGVISAEDMIPHYRLSGGVKLDGATLKSRWATSITEALEAVAEDHLIVDLRSGTYQQLGRLKGAVTVRVESVQSDGSRKVVSHFNKHYKGVLARDLACSRADARDIDQVKKIAEDAGHTIEFSSKNPNELVMVV